MAGLTPNQLPRITREYLNSLRLPGQDFNFEVTYKKQGSKFSLVFTALGGLTDEEKNSDVDILINVFLLSW